MNIQNKDYLVVLVHLCRVVKVFVYMPLLLAFFARPEGVQNSYEMQAGLPRFFYQSWQMSLHFVEMAFAGFLTGQMLRIPTPHLARVIDITRLI